MSIVDDIAINNYATLRAIGFNPERAAYLAGQWGMDKVAVTGHRFDAGKLLVDLVPMNGADKYSLEVNL